MQTYWTLTRRELGTFFYSWTGYIVIAGAMFLMGLSFVSIMDKLQGEATPMPVTEIFLSLCFWLILIFSAPIITMRLFAQEKASGTFETLMTAPVGDLQVVLAKFSAALFFYMVMWLPLLVCVFVLRSFSHGGGLVDDGTLGSTYLGILMLGMLYMAIGCFASALTRSQIVAAMTSMAIGMGLFLASFLGDQLAAQPTWVGAVLNWTAMRQHVQDFARGAVDTRCLVFYVSASIFFLFLTYRVVESRRWK